MDIPESTTLLRQFLYEAEKVSDDLTSRFQVYSDMFGAEGAFRLYTQSFSGNISWYIEVYNSIVLVVIYGSNMDCIPENTTDEFIVWFKNHFDIWGSRKLIVQYRTRSAAKIIAKSGDAESELTFLENGSTYLCMPFRGQNPGIFLDARNAREFIQKHSKGKRVLNLFAYTCGFSVAAVQGGASEVINVDMKAPFLQWGKQNYRLNNLDERRARFEKLDVMKSFGRFERFGPYDIVICDPPSAQGKSFSRKKDFPRLIRRCSTLVAPGGLLMVLVNDRNAGSNYAWELINNVNGSDTELEKNKYRFVPWASVLPCEDFYCDGTGTEVSVFKCMVTG